MIVNTPPMGWNTWNTFGADINEEVIMSSADALIESGMRDAGYNYVVIDDIWALKERDAEGRLVPDPEKFPHGMKYVADYLHERGLKFGMYSCAGYLTCAGYPGSFGYEWIDAKTFAEWEVDLLKYDFCYHPQSVRPDILYKQMSLALANCGRKILFSACSWGRENTKKWIKETGAHMWRSTGDINDSWASVKSIAQSQLLVQEYNGKGCFNDMDMLVVGMHGKGNVGMGGCTDEEYRLHFSLWAMLNSPLMIGCDIRDMTPETKAILGNKDIIAINQDPLCAQPFFLTRFSSVESETLKPGDRFYDEFPPVLNVMAKLLENGDIAIGIFNFADTPARVSRASLLPDMLGLPVSTGKTLELTDLWTKETMGTFNGMIPVHDIPAHACRMFRAKIVDA